MPFRPRTALQDKSCRENWTIRILYGMLNTTRLFRRTLSPAMRRELENVMLRAVIEIKQKQELRMLRRKK